MVENSSILRVVSPGELRQQETEEARIVTEADEAGRQELIGSNFSRYVRTQWEVMRDHRSTEFIRERLLYALRTFNGEYDPQKLAEIRRFGGAEVYARLIGVKCRGATSLLRDVFLASERSWEIRPTPDPTVPGDVNAQIIALVQSEAETLRQSGQPIDDTMVAERVNQLMRLARQAAIVSARKEAKVATEKVDDLLTEGGFYTALMEFLVDLPIFPYACIKGPTVRIVPRVTWSGGQAVLENRPVMFWERVSPFDIYWTPGASRIEDADICERKKLTRADLNDLLGLPGYDEDAIRQALNDYDSGLTDWMDPHDSERSELESTEDPYYNLSGMIDTLEFHGMVQGKWLIEEGFTEEEIPDADRDYHIQTWIVGRHVIKTQLTPSPKRRHPYFITSFEKVPGTIIGNGLPDILADIQDVANASLRSLVNNMSLASGPQVVILDDRFGVTEDTDDMYPWKRWHMIADPIGTGSSAQKPIDFYQPSSNAAELLGVYEKFTQIADDISAIPRYVTGNERLAGAGRTASGLAMLMGNASKILQTVAANIDIEVMHPLLEMLYDVLMLTASAGLRGDESVKVQGVQVALQKESERARQLEFLQITANPIDAQIIGVKGRAAVLRAVSDTLGLHGTDIVPPDEIIEEQQRVAAQQAEEQALMEQQQKGTGGVDKSAGRAQGDRGVKPGGAGVEAPQNLAPQENRPMTAGIEQRQRSPQDRA